MDDSNNIWLDREGSVDGLRRILDQAAATSVSGVLVLCCDANAFTPELLDPILAASPVPLFGAVFPRIIHGDSMYERGSVVMGLPDLSRVEFIADLSDPDRDYESQLDERIPDPGQGRTMMVFVDGFAKRINAFIESLFNVFGLEINYIGGGAGSLSMQQTPCLITRDGLKADGAVLALIESGSGVGVSHGWEAWTGPYRVTESDRNIVKTLDWRPAFDVYHEAVSAHAGRPFTPDDFFDVAKAYPFGIARMSDEQIVRDPLLVGEGGALICVGEVPEGSYVSILHGDDGSLIRAAARALDLGQAALPAGATEGVRVVMDCISRVLFLDRGFERELAALSKDCRALVGACTIGEIANCGSEYLEFYNKTAVVAVLVAR